ncbi:MAG: hypothetical protein WCT26_01945 [Candidatus Buchananbacteria bacterium]|jgi:hypothetical protein
MKKDQSIIISEIPGLAEEIGFFFDTPRVLNYFSAKVASDYGLAAEDIADFAYELALEDFNFENLEQRLVDEFNVSSGIAANLSRDILGKIFLPLDRYIPGKPVAAELASRKIELGGYNPYIERFDLFVEEERNKHIKDLENLYEQTINSPEEKQEVLYLFANDLADIISGGTAEALAGLNDVLLYLLDKDKNFHQELVKAILNNNQHISKSSFQLNGQQVDPTIANWLKAFISQKGTAIFSTLDLSNFLTNSPFTRQLDEDERKLLVKLLMVYRNIKFYPLSLDELNPDQLAIIPFEKPEAVSKKKAAVSNGLDNKLSINGVGKEEPEELTVEQKLAKYDWSKIVGIERRALLEELGVSLKDFVKWLGEKK